MADSIQVKRSGAEAEGFRINSVNIIASDATDYVVLNGNFRFVDLYQLPVSYIDDCKCKFIHKHSARIDLFKVDYKLDSLKYPWYPHMGYRGLHINAS